MSGPKPGFKFFSEASVSVINVFSEVMMQKKKRKILIGRDIRGNCKGSDPCEMRFPTLWGSPYQV